MKIPEVVLPDFEVWADLIKDKPLGVVKSALKQVFYQGYHLGRREGYEEGLNRGWAIEQDKDSSAMRQTLDNLKKAFPNGFHNPED